MFRLHPASGAFPLIQPAARFGTSRAGLSTFLYLFWHAVRCSQLDPQIVIDALSFYSTWTLSISRARKGLQKCGTLPSIWSCYFAFCLVYEKFSWRWYYSIFVSGVISHLTSVPHNLFIAVRLICQETRQSGERFC